MLQQYMMKELSQGQSMAPKAPIISIDGHAKLCKVITQLIREDELEGEHVGPILFYLDHAMNKSMADDKEVHMIQV